MFLGQTASPQHVARSAGRVEDVMVLRGSLYLLPRSWHGGPALKDVEDGSSGFLTTYTYSRGESA